MPRNQTVIRFEHRDASGLLLRAAGAVRKGFPGEPFRIVVTDDGAVAIAFCDGIGDWGDGVRGSRIAAETMTRLMMSGTGQPFPRLRDAMSLGGVSMCQTIVDEDFPPACSASMVCFRDGFAHVAWLGGAPIRLLRAGRIEDWIRPHRLIDDYIRGHGPLTPDEEKNFPHPNVLSRVLGGHGPHEGPRAPPDTSGPHPVLAGDRVVFSYQRMFAEVPSTLLAEIVGEAASPERAVDKLLAAAQLAGTKHEMAAVVLVISR